MSQRERHAGATVAPSPWAVTSSGIHGKPPESTPVVPTSWEDLYSSFSPHHRAELLELAGKQGFLFGDQLPVPAPRPTDDFRAF